jgi:DNA-binding beta-propeller fold protein YncE
VISRRSVLVLPLLAACSRKRPTGFSGYAFVANQEGKAIAVVDLEAFAVAKHIALDDEPTQVVTGTKGTSVFALTPGSGSIQEIQSDRLVFRRKLEVASAGPDESLSATLAPDEQLLYVLSKEPKNFTAVDPQNLRVLWRVPLPEEPQEFAITKEGKYAAISFAASVRLLDLSTRQLSPPLGEGQFGAVRFLDDSKRLIAANLGERRLSLYDVASRQLLTHLPLSVRPDHLCFNRDGGQLFITGEGMDAVVIVYPYHTPEVAETVLAGHAPGPMATSESGWLFIASPQSGDVSVMQVNTRKVIGVVQVGSDPGFITLTPDDQYALVLNRKSGDVAVLRVGGITPNRYKSAALFTVIPVGSKPVSAAIRAIA